MTDSLSDPLDSPSIVTAVQAKLDAYTHAHGDIGFMGLTSKLGVAVASVLQRRGHQKRTDELAYFVSGQLDLVNCATMAEDGQSLHPKIVAAGQRLQKDIPLLPDGLEDVSGQQIIAEANQLADVLLADDPFSDKPTFSERKTAITITDAMNRASGLNSHLQTSLHNLMVSLKWRERPMIDVIADTIDGATRFALQDPAFVAAHLSVGDLEQDRIQLYDTQGEVDAYLDADHYNQIASMMSCAVSLEITDVVNQQYMPSVTPDQDAKNMAFYRFVMGDDEPAP